MRQRIDVLTPLLAVLTTWLAAWTWTPFAQDPGQFLAPLAVSCLLVALSGAALRAAGLPWTTVVLCQLLLLVVWINHELASELSIWNWIPTRDSLREVGTVLGNAVEIAQNEPSPVPAEMTDFAAFPLIIGSVCALLADLLACGLRLAPLAGLPVLAMYTAPVSQVTDGVPAYKFILGAAAFVALLWSAGARRGPALGSMNPHSLGTGLGTAFAIGIPAALVATAVAAVTPTLSPANFNGGGTGGGGSGQSVRLSDPSLNLKRDLERGNDSPLVSALTDARDATYLRTSVLDLFEDGIWKPGTRQLPSAQSADGPLPPPVGLDASRVASEQSQWYLVTSARFRTTWLPLPFPATAVSIPGDWRYDASTMDVVQFGRGDRRLSLQWVAAGLSPVITKAQLSTAALPPTSISSRYAETDGIPDWIDDLADDVTRAGDNQFERAVLLQRWFSQPHENPASDPNFKYSLDQAPDGSGIEAITDFLQTSRAGYCEQFAGAMTMMARTLGIPARIAVGFLSPTRIPQTQMAQVWGDELGRDDRLTGWVYSSHDLHAWPELYFEGAGWVRFEPTPSGRVGARQPPYTVGVTTGDDAPAVPSLPQATAPTAPVPQAPAPRPGDEDPQAQQAAEGSWLSWQTAAWATTALALLAALILPRLARSRIRRKRWARAQSMSTRDDQIAALAAAEAAWAELRDGLIDLGVPFDRHTTPRRAAEGVRDLLPGPTASAALDRIVTAVERARYAAPDLAGSPARLRGEVEECIVAASKVMTSTGWNRAWRAWMPQSLLHSAGWQIDDPIPTEEELDRV